MTEIMVSFSKPGLRKICYESNGIFLFCFFPSGMKDFLSLFKEMGSQIESERFEVGKKRDELNDQIQETQKNLRALQGERSKVKQSRFDNDQMLDR